MISSVLDSQICQLQANLFTSKTCDIGGLQEKVLSPKYRKHYCHHGRKMAALGLQSPWRDKDSVQQQGNCPSSLEFGLETPQQKNKNKEKITVYAAVANNNLCSLPAYPSMCSSAVMQLTMSYVITV